MDPGLNEAGLAMARAFAAAYRQVPWAGVYVSPMLRTRNMAAPICEALGVEPRLREGLKEIAYGEWEGLSPEAIRTRFSDDYLRWTQDPAWFPPTGGGDRSVVLARRALEVVEEIQVTHGSCGGSGEGGECNVLVVSHKATIRILLCALLGIDLSQFRNRLACPVASVSVVEFTRNGPMLLALGDRGHLEGLRAKS